MTHVGIICPATMGHLNPMLSLGCELRRRGHQVTLFGIHDAKAKTLAAGIDFQVIGTSDFPAGSTATFFAQLGSLSGFAAFQYTLNWMRQSATAVLREAPDLISASKVEALLVDQISPAGGTVADYLEIPFVSVCSALLINREERVPPAFTSWSYSPSWWARLRNQTGYALLNQLTRPIREVILSYRQRWKLPPFTDPDQIYSQLAQISQQPAAFDFPRTQLPKCFHFTGPYADASSRESVSFPFEKLTGQPLVYASMGTIQNRKQEIFHCIAESCVGLDVQLVISQGNDGASSLTELPGAPLVVRYAPQLELLQRATLTITHAGLNTTLESLSNGVPMVAIPITNDQPAVGARLHWAGAGEVVSLNRLDTPKLRAAVQKVLGQDSYKRNASKLQQAIHGAGGVRQAIDIVEQVVATGKPVFR
jgi:zeaxanthin glucosyltransferase